MNKQKRFWRAENDEYVLYVDNEKISISIQNFKLDSEDDCYPLNLVQWYVFLVYLFIQH